MKLEKILDNLNSFEKNSFLKIIDGILASNPKNSAEFDKILSSSNRDLKNMDNINIAKVFNLVEGEFSQYIKDEFVNISSQLDILIDIITKVGSRVMRQEWFARLYDLEIKQLRKRIKEFDSSCIDEKSDINRQRKRDYKIYKKCLETAFYNDELNNQEKKITSDEQSILVTLSKELGLSSEEIKLINYSILPVEKLPIDTILNELKTLGVIFYSKKNSTIYVADEIARILRKIRGKEVADKFFRRILRLLKEAQINYLCRRYNIDWKLPLEKKIQEILNSGLNFSNVITEDIFKDDTTLTEKKKFLNELCVKGLKISPSLKGVTLEEKTSNLIKYFEKVEKDEKVGISIDGYDKLLNELSDFIPELNAIIKSKFELHDDKVLNSSFLLDYNIKPRDLLEIVPEKVLVDYCKAFGIKYRGDIVLNILDAYKDSDNLYLENYEYIGFRDLTNLKQNGIIIKESELGLKFEDLTKTIFSKLGHNVDEKLKKSLNTKKDKIDIVINLGNQELILIECKTNKDSGYNKFSSVSRQLKSYAELAKKNDYKVIKSLLVAPEFSDDFIKECGLEYELNLSLLTASSLLKILKGFKNSKHKQFPYNLFMRDVLIQEERILKAIGK